MLFAKNRFLVYPMVQLLDLLNGVCHRDMCLDHSYFTDIRLNVWIINLLCCYYVGIYIPIKSTSDAGQYRPVQLNIDQYNIW